MNYGEKETLIEAVIRRRSTKLVAEYFYSGKYNQQLHFEADQSGDEGSESEVLFDRDVELAQMASHLMRSFSDDGGVNLTIKAIKLFAHHMNRLNMQPDYRYVVSVLNKNASWMTHHKSVLHEREDLSELQKAFPKANFTHTPPSSHVYNARLGIAAFSHCFPTFNLNTQEGYDGNTLLMATLALNTKPDLEWCQFLMDIGMDIHHKSKNHGKPIHSVRPDTEDPLSLLSFFENAGADPLERFEYTLNPNLVTLFDWFDGDEVSQQYKFNSLTEQMLCFKQFFEQDRFQRSIDQFLRGFSHLSAVREVDSSALAGRARPSL